MLLKSKRSKLLVGGGWVAHIESRGALNWQSYFSYFPTWCIQDYWIDYYHNNLENLETAAFHFKLCPIWLMLYSQFIFLTIFSMFVVDIVNGGFILYLLTFFEAVRTDHNTHSNFSRNIGSRPASKLAGCTAAEQSLTLFSPVGYILFCAGAGSRRVRS